MKTVLLVKFAFAGLIVFTLLTAFGQARLGLDLAALVSLATSAWMLIRRHIRPMELGLAGTFLTLATMDATGLALAGRPALDLAVPALLIVQAIVGAISCLRAKPWTAVYAGAQFTEVRASPVFLAVNMMLSATWSAIFCALAIISWLRLGALYSETLTGLGIALSIFGPGLLVKIILTMAVRSQETFHWHTPNVPAAKSDADSYDVAVVGAGIGGLTAAALLAESGLKVIVCDHHVVPGGFAHTWLRKVRHAGIPRVFRFDSGVHDVSGAHPGGSVHGILDRLGLSLDWVRMTQSMDVDGRLEPIPENWQDYVLVLQAQYPGSAEGIREFFKATKTIYDSMFSLGASHSGVPILPKSATEMLAFARANAFAVEWMQRPFGTFVARYVSEPAACDALYALAGYITDRPNEMTVVDMVPLYGYYFYGGYYPKGGSGMLGHALASAIERFGGDVLLKTPVAEILTENGRASGLKLGNGRRIKAPIVISNADYKRTFFDLIAPQAVPPKFRAAIAAAEPATSAFMVHLGLVGQPEMTPIAHATLDDGTRMGLIAPSVADPSAAPDGFGTLELIVLMPNAEARRWFPRAGVTDDPDERHSPDYAKAKSALGDRMIRAAEAIVPNLSARIVMRHDASPITFARYDWSMDGSIYGVAKQDRLKGVKSPIPGVYIAGSGNGGPGVEAVAIAGARAADSIVPGILARPPAARTATVAPMLGDDEGEPEALSA